MLWGEAISEYYKKGYDTLANCFIDMCNSILTLQSCCLKYTPFLLKIIGVMNLVSNSSGIYVPTISFIIELLRLDEFRKRAKSKSEAIIEMELATKVPKKGHNDNSTQNKIVNECKFLIIQYLQNNCNKIFFPEIYNSIQHSLHQLRSTIHDINYKKAIASILQKAEKQAINITSKRTAAKLSLVDQSKFSKFELEIQKEKCVIVKDYEILLQEREQYIKERVNREKGEKIKVEDDDDICDSHDEDADHNVDDDDDDAPEDIENEDIGNNDKE